MTAAKNEDGKSLLRESSWRDAVARAPVLVLRSAISLESMAEKSVGTAVGSPASAEEAAAMAEPPSPVTAAAREESPVAAPAVMSEMRESTFCEAAREVRERRARAVNFILRMWFGRWFGLGK